MRTDLSTIQQTLTLEAAEGGGMVRPHCFTCARVATAGAEHGAAITAAYAHPLQCCALQLCFSVALDRLPASAVAAHASGPQVSNELVLSILDDARKVLDVMLKLARRNPVHDHLFPTSLRLSIHGGEGLEQRHWLDLRLIAGTIYIEHELQEYIGGEWKQVRSSFTTRGILRSYRRLLLRH